jgi:tRNA (cytidine32/uridine32-2'-O)-methyltransferase
MFQHSSFVGQHLSRIRVVLIETRTPGNIGSTARAMKTMGLNTLYLVNPARPEAREAYERAVGAADILNTARSVPNLDHALGDCTYSVAVSAKAKHLTGVQASAVSFAEHLQNIPLNENIAILFGRESTGLHRHELDRCNLHVYIPSAPDQPSLNLASAVQVIAYELYTKAHIYQSRVVEQVTPAVYTAQSSDTAPITLTPNESIKYASEAKASDQELESYFKHLERVLIELKILNPLQPRYLMQRLRRFYKRQQIEKVEINIFRGILVKTQKLIKSHQQPIVESSQLNLEKTNLQDK